MAGRHDAAAAAATPAAHSPPSSGLQRLLADTRAALQSLCESRDQQRMQIELAKDGGIAGWNLYARLLPLLQRNAAGIKCGQEECKAKEEPVEPDAGTAMSADATNATSSSTNSNTALLSSLLNLSWLQLHTGSYNEVALAWRLLYDRCKVIEAVRLISRLSASENLAATRNAAASQTTIEAAIQSLDMALMMGGGNSSQSAELRRHIHRIIAAATAVHSELVATEQRVVDAAQQRTPHSDPADPAENTVETHDAEMKDGATRKRPRSSSDVPAPAESEIPAPKQLRSSEAIAITTSLRQLPSTPCAQPLPRVHLPSLQAFVAQYLRPGTPVILTGAMASWPAVAGSSRVAAGARGEPSSSSSSSSSSSAAANDTAWSMQFFKARHGLRLVPVEIGENYMAEGWSQKLLMMREYIESYVETPSETSRNEERKSTAGEESTESNTQRRPKGYLAQHDLISQIPSLRAGICVPDYIFATQAEGVAGGGGEEEVQINVWIGPSGTVSPLHHDGPLSNLLCQVKGRKYVRLYSPLHSARLYRNEGSLLRNTSLISALEDPALVSKEFPLASEVSYWEGVIAPGEMLFIPPEWWHYVRAIEESISISFWWHAAKD